MPATKPPETTKRAVTFGARSSASTAPASRIAKSQSTSVPGDAIATASPTSSIATASAVASMGRGRDDRSSDMGAEATASAGRDRGAIDR